MSKWHGGKGSRQRDTDMNKYSAGYDAIFKKKRDGSITSSESSTGSVHRETSSNENNKRVKGINSET